MFCLQNQTKLLVFFFFIEFIKVNVGRLQKAETTTLFEFTYGAVLTLLG